MPASPHEELVGKESRGSGVEFHTDKAVRKAVDVRAQPHQPKACPSP